MNDLSFIGAAVGAVSKGTELVSKARAAAEAISNAELKLKMADLQSSLADAATALAGVKDELLAKDQEIKALKFRANFRFEAPFFIHPYYPKQQCCPKCFQEDAKAIFVIGPSNVTAEGEMFTCPTCLTDYVHSGNQWQVNRFDH